MHLSFVYTTPEGRANPREFDILEISLSNFLPWSIIYWSKRPVGGKLAKICINNLNQRSIIYTILEEYNSQISHVEKIKNKGQNFIRISRFKYVIKKNLKNIKNSSTYFEIYWHTLPKFTNIFARKFLHF